MRSRTFFDRTKRAAVFMCLLGLETLFVALGSLQTHSVQIENATLKDKSLF